MRVRFPPRTALGKWSIRAIVVSIAFSLLALLIRVVSGDEATFLINTAVYVLLLLAGVSGVCAFFTGIVGITRRKDRSVAAFTATTTGLLIGLFTLVWGMGNLLFPDTFEGLSEVWGSSSSDVFTVGARGTVLHYDGTEWGEMTSGTTERLNSVWGSSSADVFVVGDSGTIVHYDGSTWSPMTSGTKRLLRGVWGSSTSDVFTVGHVGTIIHYDGSTWSLMTSGTTERLNSAWGSSSSDVFAVGGHDERRISHYDGRKWRPMLEPTLEGTIEAIEGTIWTINVEGERSTVDVSEAEIEGEPDKGSHVTIIVMEEDGASLLRTLR